MMKAHTTACARRDISTLVTIASVSVSGLILTWCVSSSCPMLTGKRFVRWCAITSTPSFHLAAGPDVCNFSAIHARLSVFQMINV